jgi:GntR family transcriptional repressor for pyruvate dehydrogenase complex
MQPSRAAVLVDALSGAIRDGNFKPGDRLPTEQELSSRYAVSRGVVREAVASLRAEGLVITRQGSGAFVADNASSAPFQITAHALQPIQEVLDVMQLRMAVEVEAAGLAAQHRNGQAMDRIAAALDRIDEVIRASEIAVEADFEFHLAIAAATNNPYFERFMRFLGTVLIPRQTVRLGLEDPDGRRAYLTQVQAEHRAIYAAIREADPVAAREANRRHLEAGRNRYCHLTDTA